VQTVAGSLIEPGNALELATAYVDRLGIRELYVADLDAILGRASQDRLIAALAAVGVPCWLDAGVSSPDQARHALGLGATHVVVGLETLRSYDALAGICAAVGGHRVAFGLDLRGGEPIVLGDGIPPGETAHAATWRAVTAGACAVIAIDLARVGTGAGLDFELIAGVRAAAPELIVLAGGGVRGFPDLVRLADAECDGALVATALHDGRLSARDVEAAQQLGPRHRSPTR
jgi:phosphoribosylformimino-5-aminoimidazole carboxamide ribotide isomerase